MSLHYLARDGRHGAHETSNSYAEDNLLNLAAAVQADQPTYVNAKQYQRILKRREARAKLEEKRCIPHARKAFMHQSRHEHAMKRMRGPGGKFLTKAEMAEVRAELLRNDPEGALPGTAAAPDAESEDGAPSGKRRAHTFSSKNAVPLQPAAAAAAALK